MARHLYDIGALMKKPNFLEDFNADDYTLKQLRALYPDVKARSRKEFIKELSNDSNE